MEYPDRPKSDCPPVELFHYGKLNRNWEHPSLSQAGPQIGNCVRVTDEASKFFSGKLAPDCLSIKNSSEGVLIHYTDPFLLTSWPLRGLRGWRGPRLLVCGDLHHGSNPLDVLAEYLEAEPHDAVLLTFNPNMIHQVRRRLKVPVRSLPPTFFRYPAAVPTSHPRLELLHVGSLGPHHTRRLELVTALQARGRVPLRHATTSSPEEAAALYAQHALVLNVPLNHDLNHRFFEVMAAGVPQVVFGDPGLVGEHRHLAERPDVFWASTIEQLEELVLQLLAEPERLRAIPVAPPPYWELKELLKAALAP